MGVSYPSVREAAIQLLATKPFRNGQTAWRGLVSCKVNAARPNTAYEAKASHNLFLDVVRSFSHPLRKNGD